MGYFFLLLLMGLAGGGKRNGNGKPIIDVEGRPVEPDYQPGPVILDPRPVDPTDDDDDDDDDDGAEWLDQVEQLISQTPRPGRFYQIEFGDTMSGIVGKALGANNNGSNRMALAKCCTRVPWNDALYVTDRFSQSYGKLYDVEGMNLSAAFLPRHADAQQALASQTLPPRNIDVGGDYTGGQTGYLGLLWIPEFTASNIGVNCSPTNPPAWLMDRLA